VTDDVTSLTSFPKVARGSTVGWWLS